VSFISGLFKGGVEGIIGGASKLIDEITTTKEEKERLKIELETLVTTHLEKMTSLALEGEKQLLDDLADARRMNTEALKSTDKFVRRFQYYLAGAQILLTFGLFAAIFFMEFSGQQENIIMFMLGALITDKNLINSFYYGSSKSSQTKDETIKTMAGK